MGSILFLLIVIILVLWILASCIRIVPQAYAIVLERLGAYQATWGTGVHFKLPFVERVARKVNLKEQVVDFPPQPVITKDNVTMQIDTVVFFQITILIDQVIQIRILPGLCIINHTAKHVLWMCTEV